MTPVELLIVALESYRIAHDRQARAMFWKTGRTTCVCPLCTAAEEALAKARGA